jgi:DNA-binding GntR family transcriptional regulator
MERDQQGPSLDLVKRQPMRETAYQQIKEAIIRGSFAPGERLLEVDLAGQLGVSRGRVREALAKLEREGLVTVTSFRGTWVSGLDSRDVDEIYAVRILIEPWAARTVADKQDADVMSRLESQVVRMRRALDEADVYELTDADHAFHIEMVRSTGNRRLEDVASQMLDFVWRTTPAVYRDREMASRVVDEHVRTFEIVVSGDGEQAEQSVRHHLEVGRSLTLRIVEGIAQLGDSQPRAATADDATGTELP